MGDMEWFGIDLNGSMELLLEQAGVDYDIDESADELPAETMTVTRLAGRDDRRSRSGGV